MRSCSLADGPALRVLHVVPTYLPATRYGGPIYSVHGLARALSDLGHDVHVVLGSERNIKITRPADMELARFYLECERNKK